MKTILKFLTPCLAALLWACLPEKETADYPFALSCGDSFTIGALQQADTTVRINVRSSAPWKLISQPDWITYFSPDEYQGMSMILTLKATQNLSADMRTGDLVFELSSGRQTVTIPCIQASGAGVLTIAGDRSRNLDYTVQHFEVGVLSNLLDLTATLVPSDASTWLSATLAGISDVSYTCTVATLSQNLGDAVRSAKIALQGNTAAGEILSDTIYVNQMYFVEALSATLTNDDTAFKVDWTKSANPAITYYELLVTDGQPVPATLASVDVTAVTTCDLSVLPFIVDATYVGPILITVSGKVSSAAASMLAQTQTLTAGSHFAGGEGSEGNPYLIACGRHFSNIAAVAAKRSDMNMYSARYKQSADITLPAPTLDGEGYGGNVRMAGSASAPFAGVYDGDGKKLSNLYIVSKERFVGLFPWLTGEVKNLTVEPKYVAGIATASGLGTTNEAAAVGGIVGMNSGTITLCKVKDYETANGGSAIYCNNRNTSAAVDNTNYLGIAGGIAGANQKEITRCANTGCTVIAHYIAGGITGGVKDGTAAPAGTPGANAMLISHCYNLGSVYRGWPGTGVTLPMGITISAGTTFTNDFCAGGIVGCLVGSGTTPFSGTLQYCYNGGSVTDEFAAGGISGRLLMLFVVQKSYNFGTIKIVRDAGLTGQRQAGGIVGFQNGNNHTVTLCYNVGQIEADNGGDATNVWLGGIIGIRPGNSAVTKLADVVCLDQPGLTGTGTYDYVVGNCTNDAAGAFSGTIATRTSAELQSLVEPNYPATFTAADWTTTGSNPGIQGGYLYPRLNSNLFIQP